MPQVDLESLVCGGGGGGDGKVACETLVGAGDAAAPPPDTVVDDPYFPSESIEVRIGEDIDWVDINAVYERDDSTKGNTNPKSQHHAHDPHHHAHEPHRMSNSQRFSGNLKPKAHIIALPSKIEHSGYLGSSSRRPPNGRIFPKKPGNRGKSAVPESEPVSPKVSCIGKVLSERERGRRSRPPPEAVEGSRVGCWEAIFCCGGGGRTATVESVEEETVLRPHRSGKTTAAKGRATEVKAEAEAPGLGGLRRFASGRKASSWGGDLDLETTALESLDANNDGVHNVWSARRSIGSLEDAKRIRAWEGDGSSSA